MKKLPFFWILFFAVVAHSQESAIQSEPLKESAGKAEGIETLFELLSPEKTGITLVSPIDVEHPLARAYHSSSACAAVAIGDLDLDGRPDVFAGNGPKANGLYLQKGDLKFEDATESAGVSGGDSWAVGISLPDIDNDGDLDIFICNYDSANQLFINQTIVDGKRNEGPLKFVEKAKEFNLDLVEGSVVPAFADYDRDGDLDLYVLTHQIYRDKGRPATPIAIYERGGKFYVGEEWQRWYEVDQYKRGDNGEFLYTEAGRPDYLYRNDGEKGFTDVTAEAGITTERHWGNSATWWDYNHDSWPDLYIGNDFKSPDFLYQNNGDGTFTEVSEGLLRQTTWFSMGAVQSDFNNDGLIDFLLADMMPKTHYMQKASMASMADRLDNLEHVGGARQVMHNTMHINTGTDRFLEAAWMSEVAQTEWTWAIRSADFDNDGLSDLFFCNGVPRQFNHSDLPEINHESLVGMTHWDHYKVTGTRREQNLSYRNAGNFKFEDTSKEWGLDHLGMSYGASLADLNGDGHLELLTTNLDDPLSVYLNRGTEGNRITVELKGTVSNTRGIGTLIAVETPDGAKQTRQMFPYGGFLDADEPLLHFGVGKEEKISSMAVEWPSGHRQVFKNLDVNRRYTITEPEGEAVKAPARDGFDSKPTWFREAKALEGYAHREFEFDDFDRQPLLPFKLSQLGPGQAWADTDGDGDMDFYLSGAGGQAGQFFTNETQAGSGDVDLKPQPVPAFSEDSRHEDMGCLFLDVDGDGDLDLYVASGGVEAAANGVTLQDRLYLNEGDNKFVKAPEGSLPDFKESSSAVIAADYDRDGDLDLFVGSRSIPGLYPISPRSALLQNDGSGKFTNITATFAPELEKAGMVTGAIFTDVNGDGWSDLVVTTEWGPIRIFKNEAGKSFAAPTDAAVIPGKDQPARGWWTGIDSADLDGDGDLDLVATNMGRNTQYRASLESPELLFFGDFDNSGKSSIVEARFLTENGEQKCYPRRGFMAASRAMPHINDKLQTFHNYASSTIPQIYDIQKLEAAEQFVANAMDSVALINDGTGAFESVPLPNLAQISPSFGVALRDVNLDGIPDCYLVQNHFHPQEELGVYASGISILLKGTGDPKAPFETVWPGESGLDVPGDAKSLAAVDVNMDGLEDFVVGVNDADPQIFINNGEEVSGTRALKMRLSGGEGNPTGIGAKVSVKAGDLPLQTGEVKGGSGYLSQSSSDLFFAIPDDLTEPVKVTVRWPDGKKTESEVGATVRFVKLSNQ